MADIDFGQISEALNDKADRDINNLSVPGFDVTKTQVIKQVAGTIQWAEESGGGGGGGTITVDSAMSTTSTNPVQNKVISTALAAKQDTLTTAQQNAVNSGVTSAKITAYDTHVANNDIHVTAAQKTTWEAKQDALTTAQLNAANSGITAAKVTAYDGHVANGNIHVTATEKTTWTGKQDALSTAQINATNSGITAAKVTSYDTHVANGDIHVTSAQKTAWTGKQDALSTAQMSAVNSGVTSTKVTAYDEHVANTDIHVTAAQKTEWSGKQDKLTAGTGITISASNVISASGLSGVAWGDITGTLSSQTDLASALDDKATTDLDNLTTKGKEYASGIGMPSSRYVELTLGASGATYTAPANGYFTFEKVSTEQTQSSSCDIFVGGVDLYGVNAEYHNAWTIPVKKGYVARISYTLAGATLKFRFIYAEGAE